MRLRKYQNVVKILFTFLFLTISVTGITLDEFYQRADKAMDKFKKKSFTTKDSLEFEFLCGDSNRIDTTTLGQKEYLNFDLKRAELNGILWRRKNPKDPSEGCKQCWNYERFLRKMLKTETYIQKYEKESRKTSNKFRNNFTKALMCFGKYDSCYNNYVDLIDSLLLNPKRISTLIKIADIDSLAKLYSQDSVFHYKVSGAIQRAVTEGKISLEELNEFFDKLLLTKDPANRFQTLYGMIETIHDEFKDTSLAGSKIEGFAPMIAEWSQRLSKVMEESIFGNDSTRYPTGKRLKKIAKRTRRITPSNRKEKHTTALVHFFPKGSPGTHDDSANAESIENELVKTLSSWLDIHQIPQSFDMETMKKFLKREFEKAHKKNGDSLDIEKLKKIVLPKSDKEDVEFFIIGEYIPSSSNDHISLYLYLVDAEDGLILLSLNQRFFISSASKKPELAIRKGVAAINNKLCKLLTAFAIICNHPDLISNTKFDRDMLKSLVLKDTHFKVKAHKNYLRLFEEAGPLLIHVIFGGSDIRVTEHITEFESELRSYLSKYNPVLSRFKRAPDAIKAKCTSEPAQEDAVLLKFSRNTKSILSVYVNINRNVFAETKLRENYLPVIFNYIGNQIDVYLDLGEQSAMDNTEDSSDAANENHTMHPPKVTEPIPLSHSLYSLVPAGLTMTLYADKLGKKSKASENWLKGIGIFSTILQTGGIITALIATPIGINNNNWTALQIGQWSMVGVAGLGVSHSLTFFIMAKKYNNNITQSNQDIPSQGTHRARNNYRFDMGLSIPF